MKLSDMAMPYGMTFKGVQKQKAANAHPDLTMSPQDTFRLQNLRFSGVSAPDKAIEKLFSPKSIAVIGASPSEGTIGRVVIENLVKGGYKGRVYPVNPKYGQQKLPGVGRNVKPIAANVSDLPQGKVDMAIIMSPKQTVPSVVEELGKKGVKAVVVISSGFNETGASGKALEEELKKSLDKYGIKMIGPNCIGVANADPAVKMNATFVSGEITPGKAAVMSQSGAVGIDLIQKARLAGLGLAQMASIGNQADIDGTQLLRHWQKDPKVKYILGYLESIKDPVTFRKIAAEVTKQKPVVLIKSGKSETAKKAASSHTGSLAGSDTAVDALFNQTGVQRVDTISDLFNVAKAFELAPPLKGNRVAIASNSGGYGVMLTDIIETKDTGLQVAKLSDATTTALKTFLPTQASSSNPVDMIATTPADSPENFKKSLLAMINDENVDALVVALVPLLNMSMEQVGQIICDVRAQTDKPVLGVLSTGEQELLTVQNTLAKNNANPVPLYANLESAMTGLTAMEKHRRWSAKPVDSPVNFADAQPAKVRAIIDGARAENRKLMTTTESLQMLEAYGIKTAPYSLVNEPTHGEIKAEVLRRANEIGFPSAIKLVSKTITHKTDVGGVAFDLKTPKALEDAFDIMMDKLEKAGVTTFAPGEGIMVQQSVPSGRETLIGFKEEEPFGKMMAFGLGGIYVNIFKDVVFKLAPLGKAEAREMIEGIKGYPILKGYRGKTVVDFETLEETILRFSQLITDFPELVESDINPYFAQPKPSPTEKGGIAIDARFALR